MNTNYMYDAATNSGSSSNHGPPSADEAAVELLGAVDIVEAFTALRHELKLQVRSGRELQQSVDVRLQQIEQQVLAQRVASDAQLPSEIRRLAEALADIEESLQRAIDSSTRNTTLENSEYKLIENVGSRIQSASWLTRFFAGRLLSDLRSIIEQASTERLRAEKSLTSTLDGFELLLARVHRQMDLCELERINVLHESFDAESMNAIDLIDAPSVASNHVAEQLRPAYRWRGSILRYAEVRLAR